ncbi:hypothetical protein DXG03_004087 [Asterophora parasitica]|uniref:Uncharacterized protein n=1 Tax=Asterophora parasitica TaxID=117018 RepID=A0A9P7K963_9AGAR|nr:hypothetical protein DXG03_004087 [Asterophora parasitica]
MALGADDKATWIAVITVQVTMDTATNTETVGHSSVSFSCSPLTTSTPQNTKAGRDTRIAHGTGSTEMSIPGEMTGTAPGVDTRTSITTPGTAAHSSSQVPGLSAFPPSPAITTSDFPNSAFPTTVPGYLAERAGLSGAQPPAGNLGRYPLPSGRGGDREAVSGEPNSLVSLMQNMGIGKKRKKNANWN